jgi:hypothetical protein
MDTDELQRRIVLVSALTGLIMLLYAKDAILQYASRFDKVPQHTSILSGQHWIDKLIAGHDGRFYNELGMNKHVFGRLLSVLRNKAGLYNTRHASELPQNSFPDL